jgi:hypothetical protein
MKSESEEVGICNIVSIIIFIYYKLTDCMRREEIWESFKNWKSQQLF